MEIMKMDKLILAVFGAFALLALAIVILEGALGMSVVNALTF
jgi:hypothetical protein